MSNKSINGLAPENLNDIKLSSPSNYAAGTQGVTVALRHAIEAMGPKKALQTLSKLNQKNGFDCPGCAWPDPDDKRSLFAEYCENGAKAVAEEATKRRVEPSFFEKYSVDEIASWSDYKIGKSGRLTHPMICRKGDSHYKPISWEEAFKTIGEKLKALKCPDEAIFYTSGRSSNEAAFLWGLFARAFGTNNMPDCSNMCHESSGVALSQTTGIGKGSVTLEDLHKAEVVIVAGQNPGTNHPRMLSALQKCKENGGKVITINPLEEAGLKRFKNPQRPIDYFTRGTDITDVFLQVKANQDIRLVKVIIKKLLLKEQNDKKVFDHEFIENKTTGYEEMVKALNKYSIEELLIETGVSEAAIDEAVELLASAKKVIVCWAMGLTQHKNGVDTIKEYVNLLLVKGSLGIEGGGTCPVRGHSNVQGDRTVGIMHHVKPELNRALKDVFGIDAPTIEGLDTVRCIKAMFERKASVFMALGGNFLSAASDTHYTAEALDNCDLIVNISTKLNRTHLVTGKTSMILPTLGRSERDSKNGVERKVSVENSMGKVHDSRGHLEPASKHLMSEPEIVANIAAATIRSEGINWLKLGSDYDLIREKISLVIKGFENYNERVSNGGFDLPNNARVGDFSHLPDGKAQFTVCPLPHHDLAKDEFLLMTIRSHDQFNTTIYGLDDRYRGVYNERRVVFINPEDMKDMGFEKLQLVDVYSKYSDKIREVFKFHIVPYKIPRGNLAAYFPETNPLIPIDQYADHSFTPISKSIKVRLRAHQEK